MIFYPQQNLKTGVHPEREDHGQCSGRAVSAVRPLVVRILQELGWGDDVLLSAAAVGAWPEAKRGMTISSADDHSVMR